GGEGSVGGPAPATTGAAADAVSDVVDAVNRVADAAALAEELMAAACPAAYAAAGWDAAGVLDAAATPQLGAPDEALAHAAMYVDIQAAIAPLTRLGVCCEPVATLGGGAPMTRPLGLAAGCRTVQCLMATRAASAVLRALPHASELLRSVATQPTAAS